jgi:hypothetical protein
VHCCCCDCAASEKYHRTPNPPHCRPISRPACALPAPAPRNPRERDPTSIAILESAAPATGRLMATHDRPGVPIEEEHEYGFPYASHTTQFWSLILAAAMKHCRPTSPSLPTCLRVPLRALPCVSHLAAHERAAANNPPGALGHVSRGSAEGARHVSRPPRAVRKVLTEVKTRIQIINPSPGAMYSGISNAMVTISRVEGFRTLWRGLSSVVMGAGRFIECWTGN